MGASAWTGRFIRKSWASLLKAIPLGIQLINSRSYRFTKLVYLPEGQPIMDTLWKETLAEFEFAGAREILEKCKAGKVV